MRKGMGKGKGSGWKNIRQDDSRRHSLASKGIKTAQKIPKNMYSNNKMDELRNDASRVLFDRPYAWGDAFEQKEVDDFLKLLLPLGKNINISKDSETAFRVEFTNREDALKALEKAKEFDYVAQYRYFSVCPKTGKYGFFILLDELQTDKYQKIDDKIVKELAKDSRQTLKKLSREINVPVSKIFDRLKKIEKNYEFVAIRKNNVPVPEKLRQTAKYLEDNSRVTLTEISRKTMKPVTKVYDEIMMLDDYYKFGIRKKGVSQ